MRVTDIRDARCSIYTFSSKMQSPPKCHFMFDVSNLSDPQGQKTLRALNGTALKIRDWLRKTDKCKQLLHSIETTIVDIESPKAFTKGWISIGLFDHHGIWIAPAVGELLTERLDQNWPNFGYVVDHLTLRGK